jgi:uncharacterized protein (DUF849 family)
MTEASKSAPAARRVAVAVAPNGGRKTKADHPALPITADELATTAAECVEAGACIIHLHVRNGDGSHVLEPEAYRAAIARISETVGDRLVIQISSEAIGRYSPAEQRAAILATNPEAVSLALREFAPDESRERDFAEFLGKLKQMRVWPQFILYAPEEAKRLGAMHKRGLIPFESPSALYVLGRFSLLRVAGPADLLPYLAPDMPRFSPWSVCAFGRREAACVTAAALLGGHARVGFENNQLLPTGEKAASNAQLVVVVADALRGLGAALQTADGFRDEMEAASR